MDPTLQHLGHVSNEPTDKLDLIPWSTALHSGQNTTVTLEAEDFTSLCPVTGQPDYAALTIRYEPREWLVETKSLKLYLQTFRTRGAFNETLVQEIADYLLSQLKPRWLTVEGHFHARGGIKVSALAPRAYP